MDLEAGETAGPFTIEIPASDMRYLTWRSRLPWWLRCTEWITLRIPRLTRYVLRRFPYPAPS